MNREMQQVWTISGLSSFMRLRGKTKMMIKKKITFYMFVIVNLFLFVLVLSNTDRINTSTELKDIMGRTVGDIAVKMTTKFLHFFMAKSSTVRLSPPWLPASSTSSRIVFWFTLTHSVFQQSRINACNPLLLTNTTRDSCSISSHSL
ncbi:uncharacterized protein LOC124929685 [Impatiens glandulifera]|uniref:uncharacterized protein LOC124929685 n=1 Tax=Impatiens glandulifera TaxID=253017 RepID=UPI001FB10B4B|nr:uncharacterized protein LOC124929685 [Impatiens glandulifera]